MTITELPFGSWPTPVTSESVVSVAVRLSEVRVDGADVYWSEGRPTEGGRTQIVRRGADGTGTDLLPEGMDARTAVHEYGGAAWWVADGVVWFTNWDDQRVYRLEPGECPLPGLRFPPCRAVTGTRTGYSPATASWRSANATLPTVAGLSMSATRSCVCAPTPPRSRRSW